MIGIFIEQPVDKGRYNRSRSYFISTSNAKAVTAGTESLNGATKRPLARNPLVTQPPGAG
jgi:hypothetical protein